MYSIEEKFCILLGERLVSAKKFYNILNNFETVTEVIENFATDSAIAQILGEDYSKLVNDWTQGGADDIIADMQRNNVVAVTCFSDDFPQNLSYIDDKPYVLFCQGDVSLLNSECMAVIGTRKASVYGRKVAKDFTAVLSEQFTIVSGLAYGIDSIAHESALEHDGKTIAVLGSGVLHIYPTSNKSLAEKIVANGGLIVSEYGLREYPAPYHFPHRNRIVSGLSHGLLVCQAPLKSGTNSTVELALEQGKDIFAVPGEIYDMGFSGNNKLIKSMQGACVTSPRDIIDYYHLDAHQVEKQTYQFTIEEQTIVNVLAENGQMTFDQLYLATQIPLAELNFLLANLELRSIIAKLPGNIYRMYGDI